MHTLLTQSSPSQRLQSHLRSFLSRFTQAQLSAVLHPQDIATTREHAYNVPQKGSNSFRTLQTNQLTSSNVGRVPCARAEESSGHRRDDHIAAGNHQCGRHDDEHYESEEYETISGSGKTITVNPRAPKKAGSLAASHPVNEASDTDRYVQRAFDGIESTINSRWAWKDLPQQLSQCSESLCKGSNSPGARLVAIRSRLRNEQHMAIALDRVAAVLLACMRDDLGESFKGPRNKGFRVSIIGNRLLAEQLNMSRNEVLQEIRGSLPYHFAHDMISPGIILLLGARSQDM